jgi:hypothetical protein
MRAVRFAAVAAALFLALAGAAPPAARKIPGITARDSFPGGCVDCHVNRPDMPGPLSVRMKQWTEKVDPKVVARLQPFSPKGMTLKGKHPNVAAMVKDIPGGCLKCHGKGSKMAPPFATLMHGIHLTGGEANAFLTTFQGECTHCHKLNAATGEWSLPSTPEK